MLPSFFTPMVTFLFAVELVWIIAACVAIRTFSWPASTKASRPPASEYAARARATARDMGPPATFFPTG